MDIKLFYKTQRELATALNGIIDGYWENLITEEELISKVTTRTSKKKFKCLCMVVFI